MTLKKNELLNQLKGQYILTAENQNGPESWSTHTYNEWKLFTLQLPVADVYSEKGKWLGWCLGYPILDGILGPEKIILKNPVDEYDPYSDFYDRTSGKWVLILPAAATASVYLDPYGSLPAVYSTAEKTLAATPTLIGSEEDWDEQLMAEVGYPEKVHWLPSGLTFKKNVRRLLANHTLNLATWKVSRHWPTPDTDFSVINETESAGARILDNMQITISAVSKEYPLCLTITAGMDSRMVLASAKKHIQKAKAVTFAKQGEETIDTITAGRMAKTLGINHRFIPFQQATDEELEQWQYITGRCVAGGIWKIHKTLTELEHDSVLFTGQAGEVHKGKYRKSGDTPKTNVLAAEILKRCKLPAHPVLLKATEGWLAEHEHYNTLVMLDLIEIEQRMSCWGALQAFGNLNSAFEIAPSSSRMIFHTMMRLPQKYRTNKRLPYDICKQAWPELLQFPFNQHPGIKGYYYAGVKSLKKFVKRLIGR